MVPAAPPDVTVSAGGARTALTGRWLLQLRWVAVVGQLAVVALAEGALHLSLPLAPMLGLALLVAASNLWLTRRVSRPTPLGDGVIAGLLAADTTVLTALLALVGGIQNPFSALYLVNVVLATVVVGGAWMWALVAYSIGCYGFLFLLPSANHVHHMMGMFPLHLEGMWAAFTVTALVTAYFVTRITKALAQSDAELAALQQRAARDDKLASLSTLAAGAAHELATPLGTMGLIADDFEAAIPQGTLPPAFHDDARLLQGQIARCRDILHQLSADSGNAVGELPSDLLAERLLERVLASLPEARRERVEPSVSDASLRLHVPERAFTQVLRNLVSNALDASEGPVTLAVTAEPGRVRLSIRDQGAGMPPEVLARVGEPFFTTKPVGQGMGLGVFLARAVTERLGGALRLRSEQGLGTTAEIELPPFERRGPAHV
jgi:two-component system sensor histidine kinase RegB